MLTSRTLYVALELGCDKWVLASATQAAEKPRLRRISARALAKLAEEIAKAKVRFGLPADARRRGGQHLLLGDGANRLSDLAAGGPEARRGAGRRPFAAACDQCVGTALF